MTPSTRLGGFKILRGMARFSLILPEGSKNQPAELCRTIAERKINLVYLTCLRSKGFWRINLMVDADRGLRTALLIEENFGKAFDHFSESAILSIFPHKKNPEITGRLIEVFGLKGIEPDAMANSPSALSVILREEYLKEARDALFEPFSFSSYRTPEDWKLAQKGKEELYKEVVASYQEQKPKVYGLEYSDTLKFYSLKMSNRGLILLGEALKGLAQSNMDLLFTSTAPCHEKKESLFAFCMTGEAEKSHAEITKSLTSETNVEGIPSTGLFSMNGPHFGDRYGIVSELLTSFEKDQVDLLCLNCTIASIIGVVPSHQMEYAVKSIQGCFEVPIISKK